MQPRLAALGLQQADLPYGVLWGHTFHYSTMTTPLAPTWRATRPDGKTGEPLFRVGGLTATYAHFYFPSAPQAVASIFGYNHKSDERGAAPHEPPGPAI